MRRAIPVVVLLLLFPVCAGAQQGSGVIRSYKLNTSGAPAPWYPTAPTFEIDFATSPPGDGSTFVANTGQTLTQRGAPSRVTDGTWPSGLSGAQGYGWKFDGTDDYITSTIGPPAGDFSVVCMVLPFSATGTTTIAGNHSAAANTRGWAIYQSTYAAGFAVSDDGTADGGHYTAITVSSALYAGRSSVIVGSYNWESDGSSTMALYVDEATAASSTSANGPVYASAANMSVGADGGGASFFSGIISHCAVIDGTAVTEAQARAIIRGWRGLVSSSGAPLTVSSATPPAIMLAPANSGTEPFLINMPANSSQIGSPASGSGGLYGARSVTNLVQRSSFETWSAGVPTGWTEATTSTGDCAQSTTHIAHATSSAACTLADADDAVTLTSACLTVSGSTAYYLSAYMKKISGTANVNIVLIEDDSADCGSPTTTTTVVSGASPGTAWEYQGGSITTQASTVRAQVRIALPAAAEQSVAIDAVSLTLTSACVSADHYCGADTDASAACTTTIASHTNFPVGVASAGSYSLRLTVRYPGIGLAAVNPRALHVDGNSGDISIFAFNNGAFSSCIYDAAAGSRYFVFGVGSVTNNVDYSVLFGFRAGGNSGHLYVSSVGDDTTLEGTGTGITASTSGTIYFGGLNASEGGNSWVRDVIFYRRYLQ